MNPAPTLESAYADGRKDVHSADVAAGVMTTNAELLELLEHCTPDYGWHQKLRAMVAALEASGRGVSAVPELDQQIRK